MAILDILTIGHPDLRVAAAPLPPHELATERWQRFIDDLVETMRAANGAGLAAVQVGVHARIVALEVKDNPRYPYKPPIPLTIAVNPQLAPLGDEAFENWEGCLSVPGLRGPVVRHRVLRVRYLDRHGAARDELVWGLTAGTWQHECDHLDGALFVDRVRDPRRLSSWPNWEAFHKADFVASLPDVQRPPA
jgi:peptide deformylase